MARMKKEQIESSADLIEIGPAELRLDGYYVKALSYSVRSDLDEKAELKLGTGLHVQLPEVMTAANPTIQIAVAGGEHAKDKSRFRLMLMINSSDKDESPYIFDVKLVGYFSIARQPNQVEMLFAIRNGVMVLYSTAREILAAATGRGPFPAFILPTLSFNFTGTASATIQDEIRKNVSAKQLGEAKPKRSQRSKKSPSRPKKKK